MTLPKSEPPKLTVVSLVAVASVSTVGTVQVYWSEILHAMYTLMETAREEGSGRGAGCMLKHFLCPREMAEREMRFFLDSRFGWQEVV